MQKIGKLFAVVLVAFLPMMAEASRGFGGVRISVPTRSAPRIRIGNAAKPVKAAKPAKAPTANKPAAKPATTQSPQAAKGESHSATTTQDTLGVAAHRSNYVAASPMHRGVVIWWGGGLYGGYLCAQGWYYPYAIYPGLWYPVGYFGYQYNIARVASQPGIKFDLKEIPKEDRKAVENANVYVSSQGEEAGGTLGTVANFSGAWSRALPEPEGTYDVKVVLADGREINMAVEVQSQRVTHVSLRPDKAPQEEMQAAGTSPSGTAPQASQSPLVPAPTPSGITK